MLNLPPIESIAPTDGMPRPLVSLGEAFNRFNPPQGFNLGGAELVERTVRYGFRAAGFSFLIQEKLISEVIPLMPLAVIPNAPDWLVGMINLHGNLVPVCDFMRVIGHDINESTKRMILVLGKGDRAAGFLIDDNPCAVVNPKRTNNISDMPNWMMNCIVSTFMSNDEVWLEFDYENFLKRAT
jgi:twitching motility protein PilI